MPLPDILKSAYQEYKEDTNYVVSWLATTATARGFTFERSSEASSGHRLRGEAQEEATKNEPESTKDYVVKVKEFVPLANYITKCKKPKIRVPVSVVAALGRAIKVRGEFSSRMRDHGQETSGETDLTHNHFVEVLGEVYGILGPKSMALNPSPTKDTNAEGSGETVANIFTKLDLEEPSDEFLSAPKAARPEVSAKAGIKYVAEPQTQLNDALFAVREVVMELSKLRDCNRVLWAGIANNSPTQATLIAAALGTTVMIRLARRMTEDIQPLCDQHGGPRSLLETLNTQDCVTAGLETETINHGSSRTEVRQFNEYYYLAPFDAFAVTSNWSEDEIVFAASAHLGSIYPKDRVTMSFNDGKLVDTVLLISFISASLAIRNVPNDNLFDDDLTRGIVEMDRTKDAPWYLAFAGQIYIDIFNLFRDRISEPFNSMTREMAYMREDIKQQLEHMEAVERPKNYKSAVTIELLKLQREMDFLASDPRCECLFTRYGFRLDIIKKHCTRRTSPVLCGLVVHYFQARLHNTSLRIINYENALLAAKYLEMSLQHEKLLQASWFDMQAVVQTVDESKFFIGNRPKNREEHLQKYNFQLGMSTTYIARDRRESTKKYTQSQRNIPSNWKVMSMFFTQCGSNLLGVPWTKEHVQKFIEASGLKALETSGYADGNLYMMTRMTEQELRKRNKDMARSKGRSDKTEPPLDELINAFVDCLAMESAKFCFPYLKMHRASELLLTRVREACEPWRNSYNSIMFDYPVGFVMIILTELKNTGKAAYPGIVTTAAKAMNDLLSTDFWDQVVRQNYAANGTIFTRVANPAGEDSSREALTFNVRSAPKVSEEDANRWAQWWETGTYVSAS